MKTNDNMPEAPQTNLNPNLTAPAVTIALRSPAKGVILYVVTLADKKGDHGYPCRSIDAALKLSANFMAGELKRGRW